MRLQHQQLEQLVLDLPERRCLGAQNHDPQRDHGSQFTHNIADGHRWIVRYLLQGYGFPMFDY